LVVGLGTSNASGHPAAHRNAARKEDAVDERRFDTWTRAVAHSGSRRRLVRALLGGAALLTADRLGLSDTVAHHGMAGPGDPCRTDNQCVAADAPMVCAWNGYGSAGAACCTYEGSNCADDTWCCGTNVCIGGICTSQSYSCTGEGCACYQGTYDPDPCDPGLVCCLNADNSGTCLPQYTCTGYGLPGDDCPQYCLPGPTQCPGCISGYCAASGVCG
jgi:hypothetical protein